MARTSLAALLLLIATALVYGQIRTHAFVEFDDPLYVTANHHLAQGFGPDGIRWAFTNGYAHLWHPITWLSYMVDFELYGAGSARPWLLTNLGLHAFNVLLVFGLLLRWSHHFWPSVIVAAVFALHPIQVESVAWVSARKELIAGSFLLLTLWAYDGYARAPSVGRYLFVVVAMGLCLASKGSHVGLPLALLLLDGWPLNRWPDTSTTTFKERIDVFLALAVEKLPLFALSLASVTIGFRFAAGAENVWVTDPPLLTRLATLPVNLVGYLERIFWPTELAIVYPNPLQSGVAPASPTWVILSSLALIAVTTGLVALGRRARPGLVGWLFFLVMLFPMLGLAPAGLRSPHDRYVYVPILGLLIMLSAGITLFAGASPATSISLPLRRAALAAGAAAVFACAGLSYAQAAHWRDSLSLFDHSLAVTEGSAIVYYSRATALARAGNVERALPDFRRAIELHPNHADAHASLGYLLGEAGRSEQAIAELREALRIRPDWTLASVNLANVLFRTGRQQEGMSILRETIRHSPDSTFAQYWYGYSLEALGQIDAARHAYQHVLSVDPTHRFAKARLARLRSE